MAFGFFVVWASIVPRRVGFGYDENDDIMVTYTKILLVVLWLVPKDLSTDDKEESHSVLPNLQLSFVRETFLLVLKHSELFLWVLVALNRASKTAKKIDNRQSVPFDKHTKVLFR